MYVKTAFILISILSLNAFSWGGYAERVDKMTDKTMRSIAIDSSGKVAYGKRAELLIYSFGKERGMDIGTPAAIRNANLGSASVEFRVDKGPIKKVVLKLSNARTFTVSNKNKDWQTWKKILASGDLLLLSYVDTRGIKQVLEFEIAGFNEVYEKIDPK